jgi:hypothetical protein
MFYSHCDMISIKQVGNLKKSRNLEVCLHFVLFCCCCQIFSILMSAAAAKRLLSTLSNKLTLSNLEICSSDLVPELKLHLLTPSHKLWHEQSNFTEAEVSDEPFWAIFWPGGQVLTRFLLDNFADFDGQRVLDLGCGCGAQCF